MDSWGIGLNANAMTWPIYLLLVALWAISPWICTPLRSRGWIAIPSSLFGLVWLGFGLHIILRFLLLSVDSVDFGNGTFRLAVLTPEVLNSCLLGANLFWLCYVAAYLVGSRIPLPNPFVRLAHLGPLMVRKLFPLTLLLTSVCVYLGLRGTLPAAATTPVTLVGSLWVLPAAFLWLQVFSSKAGKQTTSLHLPFISLFPGLLAVWLNPYRETLLMVLVIPFLGAIFAGVRFKLVSAVAGGLVLLVAATALVQLRRQVLWSEGSSESTRSNPIYWQENPADAPWMEPLRRFHALDSFLLTVNLVPDAIPHTGENVFADAIINGLVPRVIYADKGAARKAARFGEMIWAYDSEYDESGTPIAPSMPGDLYSAGGMTFVALGAAMWGACVGICESWKQALASRGQLAVIAILALSFAASIERDFVQMISTTIQQMIVLTVCVGIVGVFRSLKRSSGFEPLLLRPASFQKPLKS